MAQEAADLAMDTLGTSNVDIFQGWTNFRHESANLAVTGDTRTRGGVQQMTYTICQGFESLARTINLGASLSADWGTGSASLKADYASRLEVSSNSIVVAVYCLRELGTTFSADASLRPGVEEPTADTLERWCLRYGDEYVSAVTLGAELIATYTFYTQSREESDSLSLDIQGSVGGVTGQFSGSVSAAMSEVRKRTQTTTAFSALITGFSSFPTPSPDDLYKMSQDFIATPPDAPAVVRFETKGYEGVVDPGVFEPVRANRRRLLAAFPKINALDGISDEIAHLQNVYDAYAYQGDARLRERAVQVEEDRHQVRDYLAGLEDHPATPAAPPELSTLRFGSPTAVFNGPATVYGVWGRDGGQFVTDVSRRDVLAGRRISSLSLRAGAYVDHLRVTREVSGKRPIDNRTSTYQFGGNGGSDGPLFEVPTGQRVTAIVISGAVVATQIKFESAVPGQPSHNSMEWPTEASRKEWGVVWIAPPSDVVVGFAARIDDGRYVRALGPQIVRFSPAAWPDDATDAFVEILGRHPYALESDDLPPVGEETDAEERSERVTGPTIPLELNVPRRWAGNSYRTLSVSNDQAANKTHATAGVRWRFDAGALTTQGISWGRSHTWQIPRGVVLETTNIGPAPVLGAVPEI